MLIDMSPRERDKYHLYMKSKKSWTQRNREWMIITRSWGWGQQGDIGQRVQILVIRLTNSRDLI